jgi:hypothetical protein
MQMLLHWLLASVGVWNDSIEHVMLKSGTSTRPHPGVWFQKKQNKSSQRGA